MVEYGEANGFFQERCPANAGYALSVGRLVIELATVDALGSPVPGKRGPFTFVVRMNGVPYNGTAEIDGVSGPVQSGILRMESGSSACLPNIWKGIEFSVRQLPKAEYRLEGEECRTGLVTACSTKKASFINHEKPLGQLVISLDAEESGGIPRVYVVRGPSFPAGENRILLPGRSLLLSGLIYGEYRVGEHPGAGQPPGPESRVYLSMGQPSGAVRPVSGTAASPRMPQMAEAAGFLSLIAALSRPKR